MAARSMTGWTKFSNGVQVLRIGDAPGDTHPEPLTLERPSGAGYAKLMQDGIHVPYQSIKKHAQSLDMQAVEKLVTSFLASTRSGGGDGEGLFFARCLRLVDACSADVVYKDLDVVAKVASHAFDVGATGELMPTFLRDSETFKAAFENTNDTPVGFGSFLNALLGEVTAKENHDRLREFLLFRYPRTANEASLSLYFQSAPFGKADAFPYTRETFEPEPGSRMKMDLPEEFE